MAIMAMRARAWWRYAMLALLFTILLIASAWVMRRPLTAIAIEHVARTQGYALRLRVQKLGLNEARLGDIRLGDGLFVRRIDLRWSRQGVRQFKLERITLSGARVHIRTRNGHVRIGSFDLPASGGKPGTLPIDLAAMALSINDSQLILDLPQGIIEAAVRAKNAPDNSWTFTVSAKPSGLRDERWQLGLSALEIAGTYASGALIADARIALGPGAWRPGEGGQSSWTGASLAISCACALTDAQHPAGKGQMSGQVQGLQSGHIAAQSGQFKLVFEGTSQLSNPLAKLEGKAVLKAELDHVKARPSAFSALPEPSKLPADIAPFAKDLMQVLGDVAADFGAHASLNMNARHGQFELSQSTASLTGADASQSTLEASIAKASYDLKSRDWKLAGNAQVQAGDMAALELAQWNITRQAGSPVQVDGQKLDLAAKTGRKSLSVQARQISGKISARQTSFQAKIVARWQGQLGTMQVDNATLNGPLRLQQVPHGWQVFIPAKSFSLRADTLGTGDWRIKHLRTAFGASPTRPALSLDQNGLGLDAALLGSSADLRNSTLDDFLVQMRARRGRVKGHLLYKNSDTASLDLAHLAVDIPGEQGKYLRIKSLTVAARTRKQAWRGDGTLHGAQFDSDGMPSHVLAKEVPFVFALNNSGLDMRAATLQFVVNSTDRPTIFPPLRVRLDTRLANGGITGKGTIMLARDNTYLADLSLVHDLATSRGLATGEVRDLHFGPQALHFTEILPSFIGLVANAEGAPSGQFKVNWNASGLSETTGSVDINGMNFDVLLGRVENVTGHIDFSSLLPLATRGAATIHIGTLDPGLVLKDGELVFALVDNGGLRIDKAAWPFAGGVLRLKPMLWKIAGLDQKAELEVHNAELLSLAQLFNFSDLDAEGKLSGTLPLEITQTSVLVHDGLLSAPDPGILRYHSAVGDNASGAAPQAQMAFDVLKNLHFNRLEMRLDGDVTGRMTASLVLAGNNPDVVYGVPFRLNITTTAEFARLASQAGEGLRIGQNIQRMIENSNVSAPAQK